MRDYGIFPGEKDVIYSDERSQESISRSESLSGLYESVPSVPSESVLGVGHRGVIEIPCDDRLIRAVLDIGQHGLDLTWSAHDGGFHLLFGVFEHVSSGRVSGNASGQDIRQSGHRDIVALKMAIVHPEFLSLNLVVRIDRDIGCAVEIYLALIDYLGL